MDVMTSSKVIAMINLLPVWGLVILCYQFYINFSERTMVHSADIYNLIQLTLKEM